MSEHSPVPPSSSARRIQCPASTTAELQFPEVDDDPDTAAGVAAHWAASETASGKLTDTGEIAPNGVYLTDEMVQGADLYHDDIYRTLAPFGLKPSQGRIEQRVAIPRVHAQSWGTPDYSIYVGPVKTLFVWDYKFGFRVVEAFENEQMIEYVAGLLPPDVDDRLVRVVVTIVQPRAHHKDGAIRRWSFMASDIRAHINIASNAAHEALGPSPRARVGPECYDCNARHACVTLQRDAYRTADLAGQPQMLELPPAALGLELRTLKALERRLKGRISGLEEQTKATLQRGGSVPGWGVQHGEGRERWTRPAAEVVAMARALSVDVAKPLEVITPLQAREKGLHPEIVKQISERTPGAATLVEQGADEARRIFG